VKSSLFDQCRAYLIAQATAPVENKPRPPLRAVTISREAGAGGVSIGRLVADYLETRQEVPDCPWAVFDRNLAREVLADFKLPHTVEQYMPEDAAAAARDTIEDLLGLHPSEWTLVDYTNRTILRLAVAGNVVIVGRGSNILTAGMSHVLHVRLVGPIAQRIRHCEEYYHYTHAQAAEFVHKTDRARARYVRRHFKADIDDPLKYHLTINTGSVSFTETARIIGDAALRLGAPAA
jgi:cytidylate kinase